MTECYIEVEDETASVSCDNCDWVGAQPECEMISDIQERISAGGVVPAGQCPVCGALTFLDKTPAWAVRKVTIEVSGGIARATKCPEGVHVDIVDLDRR